MEENSPNDFIVLLFNVQVDKYIIKNTKKFNKFHFCNEIYI